MPPTAEPPIQTAPALPVIGQETVDAAAPPTTTGTTEPTPTTKSWREALDAIEVPDEPAEKTTETKSTAPPEKPAATKTAVTKAPDKAPVEKKEPEKKVEEVKDDLPPFRTNQELRKWAKERHAAAVAAENRHKELEAKLQELQTTVPKTQQGAEALAQQLVETKKKLEHYQRIIDLQSPEISDEYQDKFVKPWQTLKAKTTKRIATFTVNEATGDIDPETEKPVVKQRQATAADFDRIYSAPPSQVRQLAREMFGEDSGEVLAMRERLSEIYENASEWLNDKRENYSKYKEEKEAELTTKQIAIQKLWHTANEAISKDPKRAEYWGEDPNDPEANKALATGFKLADEHFSAKRDQMNDEERVEFDAHIRHVIAMGPRLIYTVKKLKSENAALRAEIEDLRGSEPGSPKAVSEETAPRDKSVMERLSELPE